MAAEQQMAQMGSPAAPKGSSGEGTDTFSRLTTPSDGSGLAVKQQLDSAIDSCASLTNVRAVPII